MIIWWKVKGLCNGLNATGVIVTQSIVASELEFKEHGSEVLSKHLEVPGRRPLIWESGISNNLAPLVK